MSQKSEQVKTLSRHHLLTYLIRRVAILGEKLSSRSRGILLRF